MTRTFVLTVTSTHYVCSCGDVRMGYAAEAVASAAERHAAEHVAAGDRPATCATCGEFGDSPYWTAKCG